MNFHIRINHETGHVYNTGVDCGEMSLESIDRERNCYVFRVKGHGGNINTSTGPSYAYVPAHLQIHFPLKSEMQSNGVEQITVDTISGNIEVPIRKPKNES